MFLVDKDTPGVEITSVPRYTHTFVYEHPEFTFTDVRGRARRPCSAASARG